MQTRGLPQTVGEQVIAGERAKNAAYHAAVRASFPRDAQETDPSSLPTSRAQADDLEALARILHEIEMPAAAQRRKEEAELALRSKLATHKAQAEPDGLFAHTQGQLL